MFKTILKKFENINEGVLLGSAAVGVMAVAGTLALYSLATTSSSLNDQLFASRYNVSTNEELGQKIQKIGLASKAGQQVLKDMDMPSIGAAEETIQSVNLFERVFSKQEICLAQAVYFEGRGEPLLGQVAIAEVVLNRVASQRYPSTACGVVFQNQHLKNRCQFSFACDGKTDRPKDLRAWERSLKVVSLVMAGERSGVARQATHYHASYVSPRWRNHLNKVGEVGRHIFYKVGII